MTRPSPAHPRTRRRHSCRGVIEVVDAVDDTPLVASERIEGARRRCYLSAAMAASHRGQVAAPGLWIGRMEQGNWNLSKSESFLACPFARLLLDALGRMFFYASYPCSKNSFVRLALPREPAFVDELVAVVRCNYVMNRRQTVTERTVKKAWMAVRRHDRAQLDLFPGQFLCLISLMEAPVVPGQRRAEGWVE
jgi:hypothetical protein